MSGPVGLVIRQSSATLAFGGLEMINEKTLFFWAAFYCTASILCFATMLAHVETKLEQRIDDASAGSAYMVMRYECQDQWKLEHPKEDFYSNDCEEQNPAPSYITDMQQFQEIVLRLRQQNRL